MKSALISKNEPRQAGYRVAEVVNQGQEFPVFNTLFWQDCPDNIVADAWWFNPADNSFVAMPVAISEITHQGNVATVTTYQNPHNLIQGEQVQMNGQVPEEYTGTYNVNVLTENTFSYTMANEPATDATEVGSYST